MVLRIVAAGRRRTNWRMTQEVKFSNIREENEWILEKYRTSGKAQEKRCKKDGGLNQVRILV